MYICNFDFVFHFPKAITHNFNAWKLKLVYSMLFFSASYLCEQRRPFIDVSSFSVNSVRGANEKFTKYIYLTTILLTMEQRKMPSDQHQIIRTESLSEAYYLDIIHEIVDILVKPSILVHVDAHFRTVNGQRNARKPLENFRSGNEKQVPDSSICAFLQRAL